MSSAAPQSPVIIAISGKQYAGKDTLADWLLERFPLLEKRPLAQAIKQEYAQIHSLSLEELEANIDLEEEDENDTIPLHQNAKVQILSVLLRL